ncbi:MAG TPA: hypothetical protein VJ208_02680 [Candidatus Nanoarchaeia archaeon]|nr:hypothetical protein [Candidatus Nanoarchaeia archaeon]
MEKTFLIPEERYPETKTMIRSLSSLRFKHNPHKFGNKYQISVSGEVCDMNLLNDYLALIEKPKAEKKRGFLERFFSYWYD